MYSLMKLFLSFLLLFGGINGVMGSNKLSQTEKIPKLFVFGDSHADTGNTNRTGDTSECWYSPYGMTFHGKPSGRYSDGLISTDFLAEVLGAKPPYNYRTHRKKKGLKRGMNFAYGGAGVFGSKNPNLPAQINFLADLVLAGHVYTPEDITPEDVSFISYAGGDYFNFILENRSAAEMKPFVKKVVDDLYVRMIQLGRLQFKKIAISSQHPIGCLPAFTYASSFQSCDESLNAMMNFHNKLLRQVVVKLNKDSRLEKSGQHYFIIDMHKAFTTILKNNGIKRFTNLLKSCCTGYCARLDSKGAKMYTLCDDPKSSFFWDDGHPSQEGWRSIYSILGNPLNDSLTKA